MGPIRILVADDHPLVRTGIQALLASVPDMAVVGTAATGEEAIAAAGEREPDVILMDLHMPGINGIEATRRIARDRPGIGILVLTMLDDDDSVFAAMRAGARGYLLKGADQADVLRAIWAVAHGEAIFSPPIARRLVRYFANMRPVLPPRAFPELTQREREILGFVAAGKTNAEIARELSLAPKTVGNHLSNIIQQAPSGRPGAGGTAGQRGRLCIADRMPSVAQVGSFPEEHRPSRVQPHHTVDNRLRHQLSPVPHGVVPLVRNVMMHRRRREM